VNASKLGGGDRKTESKVQDEPLNDTLKSNTAEAVAKEFGVSQATIKRDEQFAKGLDRLASYAKNPTEFKAKVLADQIKIPKSDVIYCLELTNLELNIVAESLENGFKADYVFSKVRYKRLNPAKEPIEVLEESKSKIIEDGYYFYMHRQVNCYFLVRKGVALVIDYYPSTNEYGINISDPYKSEMFQQSSIASEESFNEILRRAFGFVTDFTNELAPLISSAKIELNKAQYDAMQDELSHLRTVINNTAHISLDSSRKKLEKAGFILVRSDTSRNRPFLKKYQNGTWVKFEGFETKAEMERRMKELELDDTIIFD
jgi:hypothetical protein